MTAPHRSRPPGGRGKNARFSSRLNLYDIILASLKRAITASEFQSVGVSSSGSRLSPVTSKVNAAWTPLGTALRKSLPLR